MNCPLCDTPSALVVSKDLDVRVTCEPCGGDFAIAHEALERWREIQGGGRRLAIERARQHLANLHRFATVPLILVYDLRAWGMTQG